MDGSAYGRFCHRQILNTGSAPFSDEIGPVAYDDIALFRKYTGTESLHGDLLTGVYSMNIIPMQDPMNGSASSYISVYDLFGYDADGFSASPRWAPSRSRIPIAVRLWTLKPIM